MTMRVFCSGFNLYGQFIKCHSLVVEGFIDCPYDEITNLEVSHTFSVAFKENDVFLHGAKATNTHQIQKIQIPRAIKILQTCCTDKRILFLSKNGTLLKLDLNKIEELVPTPLTYSICTDINESQKDPIIKISCGSKINVALSQQGKLYNLPNKLNYENKDITDIRTGCEHCLILDSHGNVYSFGRGSRGQLGLGNLEDETEPTLVQALAGIKIAKIAAGGWHSCAVSAEGDLYTWGWNVNGQLGLCKAQEETISVMASPHVVDLEELQTKGPLDVNVINVACGNRHTIVLSDNGKLYGAGWNKYHQLGNISCVDENLYTMSMLHDFSSLNVTDLKCGPWSTAVIVN